MLQKDEIVQELLRQSQLTDDLYRAQYEDRDARYRRTARESKMLGDMLRILSSYTWKEPTWKSSHICDYCPCE